MSLNGTERAAIIGQLVAVRNVVDGLLASLEEAQEPTCEHPPETRKYAEGTMGSVPTFTCQQCGAVVIEPVTTEGG